MRLDLERGVVPQNLDNGRDWYELVFHIESCRCICDTAQHA
jgi:hypothetical protein